MTDRDLNLALNVVERQEAVLLSWGVVDGGFTYEELVAVLDGACGGEGEGVLSELYNRRLVLPFTRANGDEVWRSRAGEAVRLASGLRQLFPYHFERPSGWLQAPELVAGFRYAVRPRRYPVREHAAAAVEERVSEVTRLSGLQRKALHALVGSYQLAAFQVEATARVLADADGRTSRGLIVGAGTGTGKTLAFYLPALLRVAESVSGDRTPWVRVLALYPRNELLKDQLTTALGRVLTLNEAMRGAPGFRPVSIGAYYGDTPYGTKDGAIHAYKRWPETREGWRCPFLRDPRSGSALVWRRDDVGRGVERLHIEGGGALVADGDVLRLTRDAMVARPPDLLFASTEMLQRAMGTAAMAPLFGVRSSSPPPELVLLDEAHTYGGTSGAQVAYLLRRYRHALKMQRGPRPHFTGLSATLANAIPFFSDLVGLPEHAVAAVRADDPAYPQVEAGHEYLLALRGHPFSGAGLLSTTIQATGLLRRVLDPSGPLESSVSRGLVGQRVFAFTDDLDVTNRLYDDLADAEGLYQRSGRYVQNPHKEPLAALRSAWERDDDDDEPARFEDGQSWRIAETLGHDPTLRTRLHVERVSSQDAGFDASADLVVATASLEVGFDDDFVGAVVQHKAPRDVAQFLQRKGRAGRSQEMRPWTMVTLSDYGRDRAAYQNYDALFDPEVQPQHLPLGNRYVLRMHAAAALLDWASARVLSGGGHRRHRYLDPYRALSGPPKNDYAVQDQEAYLAVLRPLLEEPEGAAATSLARHVSSALGVGADEAAALLWEPPRALMTGAVPTLVRRIERGFRREGLDAEPATSQPLPGFIPENLFSDLDLPEVLLHLPSVQRATFVKEYEPEAMPVDRALREYAAGRVSRRFASGDSDVSHWVPVPTDGAEEADIEIGASEPGGRPRIVGDPLGLYQYAEADGHVRDIPVVRPYHIGLSQVPRTVLPSSNARARWHSQILPPPDDVLPAGALHEVSGLVAWSDVVGEVRFYTHLARSPVEVRRFTTGGEARLLAKPHPAGSAERFTVSTRWVSGDEPVALGLNQAVDAVAFRITVPSGADVLDRAGPALERTLRTAYLRHLIVEAAEGLETTDPFQREWMYRAVLGASARRAARGETAGDFRAEVLGVLDHVLEAVVDPESEEVARRRSGERLAEILGDDAAVAALERAVTEARAPAPEAFGAWVEARVRTTLGAALLTACGDLTPGQSEDGLLLDLHGGPSADEGSEGVETLWVTESAVGGNGLVEAVLRGYVRDPRAFFESAERALQASDLELVAAEMPRVLRALRDDPEVARLAESARHARGVADSTAAHGALREGLSAHGVLCTHGVYAALTHRLLRPGSDGQTAVLVDALVERWDALEEASGFEVDSRVFSYLAADDATLTGLLSPAFVRHRDDPVWRAGAYASLLWSRGGEVRSAALQPYNPYVTFPPTDREALLLLLTDRGATVDAAEAGWRSALEASLTRWGSGHLEASTPEVLSAALLDLAAVPLEAGFLHVHPQVSGTLRTPAGYRVRLLLPEAVQ